AVNEPRFDSEPVARIRGQISANLRQDDSNPGEIASRLWAETLFGDHPYGRNVEGTPESMASLTPDDLREMHGRVLARDNLHVVIVGAIAADAARQALDRMFADLPEEAQLQPVADIAP